MIVTHQTVNLPDGWHHFPGGYRILVVNRVMIKAIPTKDLERNA